VGSTCQGLPAIAAERSHLGAISGTERTAEAPKERTGAGKGAVSGMPGMSDLTERTATGMTEAGRTGPDMRGIAETTGVSIILHTIDLHIREGPRPSA
jgi:hypothetical protein